MSNNCPRTKIVAFLGAGASCFAGYYTFVGFPELLFNTKLRQQEGMPLLSDSPERILRAIKESLERNNTATTHDNFLWRLDGYKQFLNLNQSDDVLQGFLRGNNSLFDLHVCTEQAISQISATTVIHYSGNRVEKAKISRSIDYQNMRRVFDLYRALASLNGSTPFLPIFTTNYDMLLEDLSAEFASPSQSAPSLVNGIPRVSDELATWTEKEYERPAIRTCGIHLCRLHGCACWFYHDTGDSNVYFHRKDAAAQPADKVCAMYPGRERQRGATPHGFAFRRFYRSLLACDLVVFIGFSFRDDDVMHVLLKALAERHGRLKVLIVDVLYHHCDVQKKLEDAAKRSTFPCRVPRDTEIHSLKMRFGEDDFDARVLEACLKSLK